MKSKTIPIYPNQTFNLLMVDTTVSLRRWQRRFVPQWLLIGMLLLPTQYLAAQTDGFTTNFNYSNGTTYGATLCANDMGDCNYWSNTRNSQIYDNSLRIRFEADRPGISSGITAKLNVNGDRVYSMEYRIKFDKEFQWREGGKLPGLAGGQAPTGGTSGVRTAKDGDGFSTRFMWRPEGKLVVYAYYRDMPLSNGTIEGTYGEDWDCDFTFEDDSSYTLKQQVTVNTGSNYNGRVEVWVDGEKKLDKRNVRLMTNNNRVNVVFFDTFMGGGINDYAWSPTQTQYLRIDDVKVVKGGEVPTPTEPDAIVSVTAPDAVTPGEVVSVEVNYSASTGRDLQVDLQGNGNPDYSPYGSGKVTVPAGSGTATVEIPVDASIPIATDAYQFQVYLSPTGLGWNDHTTNQTYGNVDAVALPAPVVQTPYGGSVPTITDGTTLQAEDYDEGGPGVAYNDNTPNSNAGNQYRTEGVDIGLTPNGNTAFVGWIQAGEWLEYTVDVTGGTYDIQVSMASPNDDRTLRLKLGDQTLGTLDCPNSSTGWYDFRTATLSGVALPAGEQVLRLEMVDGSFNIDAISFVRTGGNSSGNVTIRAKGSQGSEQMSLVVDGQVVQSWTVATAPDNYTYEGYTGGQISVSFDNDGGSGSTDRNLAVNYIQVCGTQYKSNGPGVVRTGCGVDNDAGFAWLWCSGSFDFGDLGCSAGARTVVSEGKGADKKSVSVPESFGLYPNPASEQLTVEAVGREDYQITMYDMTGRLMLQHDHLKGKTELDIRHLQPGVYLLKLRDGKRHELRRRIIVE